MFGDTVDIEARPNILWIVAEDMSPTTGSYGDLNAVTPNLDAFAETGVIYRTAWATAPVCSAARTSLITGMYAHSLGAHHHRPTVSFSAPSFLEFFPKTLRDAGYYTSNTAVRTQRNANGTAHVSWGSGKLDYNLNVPDIGWVDNSAFATWRGRGSGQPFFSVINIEDTHESRLRMEPPDNYKVHDPDQLVLPNVHPDTVEVREDWARHYDWQYAVDARFGQILEMLEQDGLLDDTIIFFYGDHGSSMPGFKRFVGSRGQRVPFLLRIPDKFSHLRPPDYEEGNTAERLVSFVDFAPTLLSFLGEPIPGWMQGKAFAGPLASEPRDHLFGFIGRIDERTWWSRSVSDGRYVLIRNYRIDQPHGFYSQYVVGIPSHRNTITASVWMDRFNLGPITDEASQYWTAQGAFELYDLLNDPWEVNNLAEDPDYDQILTSLHDVLIEWQKEVVDGGMIPEGWLIELALEHSLTPYEVLSDPQLYPFSELSHYANLVSTQSASGSHGVLEALQSDVELIQFWGLWGALMNGRPSVQALIPQIVDLTNSDNHFIQVAANQALATHGNQEQRQESTEWLFRQSSFEEFGGTNLATGTSSDALNELKVLFAMEALDQLGYLNEQYRSRTSQLQNQTWMTRGYRRHIHYWFYTVFNHPLGNWRNLHGLNRSGRDDFQSWSNDGIANIMKFLFNTAENEGDLFHSFPNQPRVSGSESKMGFPIAFPGPSDEKLIFRFIRPRINVPISYEVRALSSPDFDQWYPLDLEGSNIKTINSTHELVELEVDQNDGTFFYFNIGRDLNE